MDKIINFKKKFENNKVIKFFENDRFITANKYTVDGYNTIGIFSKKTKKEYIADLFITNIKNGKEIIYCISKNKPIQEVL